MNSSINFSFESGAAADHPYPGGFEGPEKRLEIDFKPSAISSPQGFFVYTSPQWQELLDLARCTILNVTKNEELHAFVLSESSLFVYPYRVILKTCGTTTLLRCVNKILEYANAIGLELELVRYSRKNFLFPEEQLAPHCNWEDEVEYLNSIFQRGVADIFGSPEDEPWYCYIADFSDGNPKLKPNEIRTLEIMMHQLSIPASQQFVKKKDTGDRDKHPAIAEILNHRAVTDEFNFTPCGYSMNALEESNYHTVHVTPESHCSYASYECNTPIRQYATVIDKVFSVFEPGTAQIVLFIEKANTDASGPAEYSLPSSFFEVKGYELNQKASRSLDSNCHLLLLHYKADGSRPSRHQAVVPAN